MLSAPAVPLALYFAMLTVNVIFVSNTAALDKGGGDEGGVKGMEGPTVNGGEPGGLSGSVANVKGGGIEGNWEGSGDGGMLGGTSGGMDGGMFGRI